MSGINHPITISTFPPYVLLASISAPLHPYSNFWIAHLYTPFLTLPFLLLPVHSSCLKWSQVIIKQDKLGSFQSLVPTRASIASICYCWRGWLRDTSKFLVFSGHTFLLSLGMFSFMFSSILSKSSVFNSFLLELFSMVLFS